MSAMRTIRVTGKGALKVHPDMTRVGMMLKGGCPEYRETIRRSSEDTEKLMDVLAPFGFERSDLKTKDYTIDPENESYEERGVYKSRLVGYKYRHILMVEFESDDTLLGRLLYALANSDVRPQLNFSYTVKDLEAVKNRLLGKAVADAKDKAVVLTEAAGVTLRDIQSIDYSWGQLDLEVRSMNSDIMMDDCFEESMDIGSYDLGIEPDDISVSDTVTVVWEIA